MDYEEFKELVRSTLVGEPILVEEDLDLSDCAELELLPENLSVSRNLNLTGCIKLHAIPKTLKVGGYLILTGCTGLKSLPWLFRARVSFEFRSIPSSLAIRYFDFRDIRERLLALGVGYEVGQIIYETDEHWDFVNSCKTEEELQAFITSLGKMRKSSIKQRWNPV